MKLKDLQRHWDRLGEMDPMWAIIAAPTLSHNRWEAHTEEFFNTGERDADLLLSALEEVGVRIERGRCLDFGCGLGRVTQALCRHFDRVDGVDVADSMIRGARRYNRYGDRCQYRVNQSDDLRLFKDATFDCIYTRLVLQHMRPEYSKRYISEFIRILKPGGATFFEIPARPRRAGGASPTSSVSSAALPAGAHRAEITVAEAPETVRAGEVFPIRVRVRNLGDVPWPSNELVRLGNHWSRHQRRVVLDDGRVGLPDELRPGQEATLVLYARAPRGRGAYEIELDMVEEWTTWFADQGSPTTKMPIRVTAPISIVTERVRKAMRKGLVAPKMEMHYVPTDEVVATVEAAGGKVVNVAEWDVNPQYEDYRYIAVRLS